MSSGKPLLYLLLCCSFISFAQRRPNRNIDLKKIVGDDKLTLKKLPKSYSGLYRLSSDDLDSVPKNPRFKLKNFIEISKRYAEPKIQELIFREYGDRNKLIDWQSQSKAIEQFAFRNASENYLKEKSIRVDIGKRINQLRLAEASNKGKVLIPYRGRNGDIQYKEGTCTDCTPENDMSSPSVYLLYLFDLISKTIGPKNESRKLSLTDLENILFQEFGSLITNPKEMPSSYVEFTNEVLLNRIIKDRNKWGNEDAINDIYKKFSDERLDIPYPNIVEDLYSKLIQQFGVKREVVRVANKNDLFKAKLSKDTGIPPKVLVAIGLHEKDIDYAAYLALKKNLEEFLHKRAQNQIKKEKVDSLVFEYGKQFSSFYLKLLKKEIEETSSKYFEDNNLSSVPFEDLDETIKSIQDSINSCIAWDASYCKILSDPKKFPIRPLETFEDWSKTILRNNGIRYFDVGREMYEEELNRVLLELVEKTYDSELYVNEIELLKNTLYTNASHEIEKGFHTQLRENLLQLILNGEIDRRNLIEDHLALDLGMAESYEITALAFVILRIQSFILNTKWKNTNYEIGDQISFFNSAWDYLKSYGNFHAAKQIEYYPGNFISFEIINDSYIDYDMFFKKIVEGSSYGRALFESFSGNPFMDIRCKTSNQYNCPPFIIYPGYEDEQIKKQIIQMINSGYPITLGPDYLNKLNSEGEDLSLVEAEFFLNVGLKLRLMWSFLDIGDYETSQYWLSTLMNTDNGEFTSIYLNNYEYVLEEETLKWLETPWKPVLKLLSNKESIRQLLVKVALEIYLDWANYEFAFDSAESVNRARNLYKSASNLLEEIEYVFESCDSNLKHGQKLINQKSLYDKKSKTSESTLSINPDILNSNEISQELNESVVFWLADDHNFCVPPNPIFQNLKKRIDNNLFKIRTNRNFAGLERNLAYYAAPIDPTYAIQQAQSNVNGTFSFNTTNQFSLPPIYRFNFLLNRAKQQAQYAMNLESNMLSAYKELDATEYTELQARNGFEVSLEMVTLQNNRIDEAKSGLDISHLQKKRSDVTLNHYESLLNEPLNSYESEVLKYQEKLVKINFDKVPIKGFLGSAMAIVGSVAKSPGTVISGLNQVFDAATGESYYQAQIASNQTLASYERRKEEWQFQKDLAEVDQQISELGIQLAEDRINIVNQEKRIAELQTEHAKDNLEFLVNTQFTNGTLYRWMSSNLKRLYQTQLNRAVSTAKAAQDALEFEQQTTIGKIGNNYWIEDKRGLLGAENLLNDLENLETYRLQSGERKKEITKVISVANMAPEAFQNFVETGELFFATPSSWFDRDFPGHYLRMVNNVSVTLVALTNYGQGINATLSNNGTSRIISDPILGDPTIIYRQPESIALSQTTNANGLFQLLPNDPLLYPFEGTGVDTQWTLEMPKGSNPIDYESIVDVIFTINYTAKESFDLKRKVLDDLGQDDEGFVTVKANRFFSLAEEFPDTWYYLQNPELNSNEEYFSVIDSIWTTSVTTPWKLGSMVFELDENDFVPNEQKKKIKKISLLPIFKDGLEFVEDSNFKLLLAHAEEGSNNLEQTEKAINLSFLDKSTLFSKTKSPYGYWAIQLNGGTVQEKDKYSSPQSKQVDYSDLKDLIFIIEYEAKVHYPR